MPATDELDRPDAPLAVAQQYHRRERAVTTAVSVVAVAVVLATYIAASLLAAIVAGALVVAVLRVPLLRPRGTIRLRTADPVAAVVASFTGPTPPILALQWGTADACSATEAAATYQFSYLFGLQSVEMTVQAQTESTPDGSRQVTVRLTANDRPWATYTATIARRGDQTIIEAEYTADRRFGLRRLPQRLLAGRYRDRALAAQGYTVVERAEQLGP